MENYFSHLIEYDRNLPFNLEVEPFSRGRVLKFDATYEPDVPESKRIHVFHFTARRPWLKLLFLHGIGNSHVRYLIWFGERFAAKGVDTYFMIHPYHLQRARPGWNGGEPFFHHSPSHCVIRFHQAVKDVRRTLDLIDANGWGAGLPTAVMGFSFGGMIATMAMALDKRLVVGILAFTGGDWRWINWYSPYLQPVRTAYEKYGNEWGCRDEIRCANLREAGRKKVAQVRDIAEIFELRPTCFHYDPISFAKLVEQPVLMFSGIFDRVIPRRASDSLYRLLPNVRKVSVPSGHKSSYLFRRFILEESITFLSEHLGERRPLEKVGNSR